MATAVPSEADECALCLNEYQDPRFLPCHHTFCAQCISDLASQTSAATFPCPVCRKPTTLPAGGAEALQANFYIKTGKKKKDGKQTMCLIHEDEKLKYYCVKCRKAICLSCKITEHEGHETKDLSTVAAQKKMDLKTGQKRLEQAVADVIKKTEAITREQGNLGRKRAALERDIRDRHATMVAAADQARDEALQSLESELADIEDNIAQRLKQQQDNLQQLQEIQQRLQQAFSTGSDYDVIMVDEEMTGGRGSEESVKKLTSLRQSVIFHPVLRHSTSTDVMLKTSHGYLGTVCSMKLESGEPEVRVEEKFRAGQGPSVEVFSLCPVDDDPPVVWVSYERQGLKEDAPVEKYRETGKLLNTGSKVGMVSRKRYTKGKHMSPRMSTIKRSTYCKSLSGQYWRVDNSLKGKADVGIEDILSSDPLKTKTRNQFTINVGVHRSSDMDHRDQFLVIVEEAQPPDVWRKVRMYQRSRPDPVATYTPPTPLFQPSDVCFYSLGGQHVLLVTDQANDVIHVVSVQEGRLTFLRYLATGCPSLIQPTAINVDVSGQLWVACRGGSIITMQPKD